MYRTASARLLAAGFEHYEISNYARPGHQCRHNRVYWHNQPFYGFGMGAASYLQGLRFSRPRTRANYYHWLAEGCPLPQIPETDLDRAQETLMLGLRLAEGLDLHRLGPFASGLPPVLAPYEAAGQVVRRGDRLRLSDPEGFLISNRILSDCFAAMEACPQP
jgi:oxygen-independent coproporphyrinogen-3 oxidase